MGTSYPCDRVTRPYRWHHHRRQSGTHHQKARSEDTFEAIERRIWWGLLIGLGLLLIFNQQWSPWLPTLLITAVALLVGLLVARFMGIVLDGSVPKQWLLVLVEVAIAAPLLWWYLRIRL
jgi:hypothetical protein